MSENKDLIQKENQDVENYRNRYRISPLVDIYENKEEVLLMADLPGVDKKDLSINLDNNTLTVEGFREIERFGAERERELGSVEYYRAFSVPKGIDKEKIQAELKEGVLSLHLPKSPELKPREISITTG